SDGGLRPVAGRTYTVYAVVNDVPIDRGLVQLCRRARALDPGFATPSYPDRSSSSPSWLPRRSPKIPEPPVWVAMLVWSHRNVLLDCSVQPGREISFVPYWSLV